MVRLKGELKTVQVPNYSLSRARMLQLVFRPHVLHYSVLFVVSKDAFVQRSCTVLRLPLLDSPNTCIIILRQNWEPDEWATAHVLPMNAGFSSAQDEDVSHSDL